MSILYKKYLKYKRNTYVFLNKKYNVYTFCSFRVFNGLKHGRVILFQAPPAISRPVFSLREKTKSVFSLREKTKSVFSLREKLKSAKRWKGSTQDIERKDAEKETFKYQSL